MDCKYNVKEFTPVIKQIIDLDDQKIVYPIVTDNSVIMTGLEESPVSLKDFIHKLLPLYTSNLALYDEKEGEDPSGKAFKATSGIRLVERFEEVNQLVNSNVDTFQYWNQNFSNINDTINQINYSINNTQQQINDKIQNLEESINRISYKYQTILFKVTDSNSTPNQPIIGSGNTISGGWAYTYDLQDAKNKYIWMATANTYVSGSVVSYGDWQITSINNSTSNSINTKYPDKLYYHSKTNQKPEKPTGVNNNWSETPLNISKSYPYLYVSARKYVDGVPTDEWLNPVLISRWSAKKETSHAEEFIFAKFNFYKPTWSREELNSYELNPANWTSDEEFQNDYYIPSTQECPWENYPSSLSEDCPYQYISMRQLQYNGVTDSYQWSAYTEPALFSSLGKDGETTYTDNVDLSNYYTKQETESYVNSKIREVSGGGDHSGCVQKTDIVNNLVQGGTTKVLSAQQGVEIKNSLDYINTKLAQISQSSGVDSLPKNTVKITESWWRSKVGNINLPNTVTITLSDDNTNYVIADTADKLTKSNLGEVIIKFEGKNCMLSAEPGCMFGNNVTLAFNRMFINVGQQQIFSTPEYYFIANLQQLKNKGTRVQVSSTFANGQILPEWWGAKQGEGVLLEATYRNKETIRQGMVNSCAINYALSIAGDSEVYLPGSKYVVGSTIMVGPKNIWGKLLPGENDSSLMNDTDKHGNRNGKLRVKGSLIATDQFYGYQPNYQGSSISGGKITSVSYSSTRYCEIPAVVLVDGSAVQLNIEGAIVVPYNACDKKIQIIETQNIPSFHLTPENPEITTDYSKYENIECLSDGSTGNTLIENPQLNKMYFVGSTYTDSSLSSTAEDYYKGSYDIYLPYEEFTDEWDTDNRKFKTIIKVRKIGHSDSTSGDIEKFNLTTKDSVGGCNGKMTGMYGLYLGYIFGANINVKRIVKGHDRGGYWNWDKGNVTYSYRYRTEVLHMGECCAVNFVMAQCAELNIDQIVGFNDGIGFEKTYSKAYSYVQHCRFKFGNIECNNAIHMTVGKGCHHSMVDRHSNSGAYFNACVWHIGGSQALCAGSNMITSAFIPTKLRSTYILVEGSGDEGSGFYGYWHGNGIYGSSRGFGQNVIYLEPGPDSCYVNLFDMTQCNGNHITSHSNINGDTGRLILWRKKGSWIPAGQVKLAPGEELGDAWFPIHTFVGMSSLASGSSGKHEPVNYAHLSALTKLTTSGNETTNVSNSIAKYIWNNSYYNSSEDPWYLWPKGMENNSHYNEVNQFPFDSTRLFMNFKYSTENVIENNGHDVFCYDAIYSDTKSWGNKFYNCQSRFSAYEDTATNHEPSTTKPYSSGFWTIRNPYMPFFKTVRFDNHRAPDLVGAQGNTLYRVMLPDEYTLKTIKFVNEVPSSDYEHNMGLYVDISKGIKLQKGSIIYPMYHIYYRRFNDSNIITPTPTYCKEKIGYFSDEFGLLSFRNSIIEAITDANDFNTFKNNLLSLKATLASN